MNTPVFGQTQAQAENGTFKPANPKSRTGKSFLRLKCPCCKSAVRTVYSEQITDHTQDRRMICDNPDCLALFKVQVSFYATINEPVHQRLATLDNN